MARLATLERHIRPTVIGSLESAVQAANHGVGPTLVGVLSSYLARQGEIEKYLCSLLGVFSGAHLLIYAYVVHALSTVLLINAAFFTGLFGNIVLYRLFFHRLRHVPGPVAARITRLYASYLNLTQTQMHYTVQRMHREYGDVIRIGPREISICRSSAIQAIYGPPTRCTKSPWYDQVCLDKSQTTMFGIRDVKEHNKRRRVWDQGIRAQGQYQDRVAAKVKIFGAKLGEQQAHPINVTKWMSLFALDAMGDIVLGTDPGLMDAGQIPHFVQQIRDQTKGLAVGGTIPWLPVQMLRIPGVSEALNPFRHFCHAKLERIQEGTKTDDEPSDLITWLIQAQRNGDPGAPSSDRALKDDAWFLGGRRQCSDTIGTTLTNALFYLATHPAVLDHLHQQLDEAFPNGVPDWSFEGVKDMSYPTYILSETLRLKPPVPGGLSRVTPPEGLQIDEDLHIPGDVIVSAPTFTIHRDPRLWEKADQFIPERWAEIETSKAPFFPFSRGAFDCVGKGIAWMEMRMALSMMALAFEIRLADASERAFDGMEQDSFTMVVPELRLRFQPRQR
ncbi:benzoate 4-monooxygenase cytochrome P450 [Aspergillus ellipticus CBS 707.79]|uniref:Benzoate 4-monooxygenase cytochrome P450 n=1 Tax=Aspergillus ellipticus CBS 707.79 TaxID=1448320 RepID=A0A319DAY7_9EURO|nr:benzoate 4-monooxygenase cytochrome P450 [Aspergillus ellipticus CBS 707.79]